MANYRHLLKITLVGSPGLICVTMETGSGGSYDLAVSDLLSKVSAHHLSDLILKHT